MLNRFAIAALVLATGPAVAASKYSPPAQPSVADQITTAAVDVAKKALETKLSRLPPEGAVEIAFSPLPQRSAEHLVEKVINTAQATIYVAAYEMTSKPIADALCRARKRGAAVSVLLDAQVNSPDNGSSKGLYLAACGANVRLDARYPVMHDKFIVVDGKDVETGSFNYTFSASDRNAENAIVLWNSPRASAVYSAEFLRLFTEAGP